VGAGKPAVPEFFIFIFIPKPKTMTQKQSTHPSFFILIIVFFFWGFLAASNGIFIPFCKTHFNLTQLEAQLIETAFYGAYYVGSLVLYFVSLAKGFDVVGRMGYKKAIIYGLAISVAGALSMIPAINSGQYSLILAAFFLIALGFSLQQTGAQPFAIALGDPASGSHRLNMAGGVNSLGTTLGPIIVAVLLFGSISGAASADIAQVNILYLILAGVFVVAILILSFGNLPAGTNDEPLESSSKATNTLLAMTILLVVVIVLGMNSVVSKVVAVSIALVGVLAILLYAYLSSQKNSQGWGAMQYGQLVLGMIGIFVYVGVEVTIQSNMGALFQKPEYGALPESQIDPYISLYWGSLMVGRWMGGIAVFNLKGATKTIANVVVPIVAFGIVLAVNALKGSDVSNLYGYLACVLILIAVMFYGQEKPAKTLLAVSIFGMAAMLVGLMTTGTISIYAFLCGGLCCSVMWPCIFALAVAGLGKYTPQASTFLIMMILGGAIIPPFQGGLADTQVGIHGSYWVAVICFAYLAFFAICVKGILKSQGIDFEGVEGGGGH
jgi:MFS transporter, FHS family, L-fucose permease